MQKKFKEIGNFSRVHGYKGKIVISFNSEDPSILKKNSTIWIEEFGIPSPYKIKDIQNLNHEKWPFISLPHVMKGGHYVYFNSNNWSS